MNNDYVEFVSYTLSYLYKDEKTRIDMSYKIDDSILYIKTFDICDQDNITVKVEIESFLNDDDQFVSKELVNTLPKINDRSEIVFVNSVGYRITDLLEKFLVDYLSLHNAFMKETIYHSSIYFTKERFGQIMTLVGFLVEIKTKYSYLISTGNKLLEYFYNIKLNPKKLGDRFNWLAECPASKQHLIWFSTQKNTWKCQQCKKEGGLKDLTKWYDEIKAKH